MTSANRDFITAEGVADMLGLPDGAAFLRRRADLEGSEDFPPPMPHIRRPLLWRKSQVAGWIEAQGRFAPDVRAADVGPNVVLMREARRA